MRDRKKHKALEEEYDHYTCEFCMEIGEKEATKEFLEDCKGNLTIEQMIKKWEKRLKK